MDPFKTVLLMNCHTRIQDPDNEQATIKLGAAYPGNQQPALQKVADEFFKASPSAQFEFTTKPWVLDKIKRGKYYLVTIQEFDPEKPWQEQL